MNASTTTIATTAVQIDELDSEPDLTLDVAFHYDPADPFAVTMVLESIGGPVPWTFARDLILQGQFEPTGDGDVHIWPCLDTEGAAVVIVELDVPSGSALLQIPARAVQEFIGASLAMVSEGAEQHDLDAWIEQLLLHGDTASS